MKSFVAAAGLFALTQAYTQPVQPPTYGSLLTPDVNNPVTTGQDFTITWSPKQPTDGVTVSLVLCNGPSSNCVLQPNAIVEKVPAAQGSYKWSVPCSLPSGVQSTATGYGMLIIVDGTGEFQYSTQFSVNAGASCGSSSSSTTTSTTTSSTSSSSSTTSVTTTTSGSTSSSSSASGTSSVPDGWAPWNTVSSSSTLTTSTTPAKVVTTPSSTPPAVVTTPSVTSKPSTSTPAPVSTTSSVLSTPKPFTGAAAMPTAFVNAAGLVGAAALAALAL